MAQHLNCPSFTLTRRVLLAGIGALGMTLAAERAGILAHEATPEAESPPGALAPINGVEIYYEVRGDAAGEPVLLLHGGLSSLEDWSELSPALEKTGYRVILMDTRGHGRSTWDGAPLSYAAMASDALGLLDLLGIEQAHLVGWSDGAITGLQIAITEPERLNRGVIYAANFTPDGLLPEIVPSDQLPTFEQIAADYQRLSPAPERFEELLGALMAMYAVAPNFSEEELGGISTPVLILGGANEEMIKPDQPVRIAELIPGAELVLMPDTGHYAPLAKPEEFNQIVLAFLGGGEEATPVL